MSQSIIQYQIQMLELRIKWYETAIKDRVATAAAARAEVTSGLQKMDDKERNAVFAIGEAARDKRKRNSAPPATEEQMRDALVADLTPRLERARAELEGLRELIL